LLFVRDTSYLRCYMYQFESEENGGGVMKVDDCEDDICISGECFQCVLPVRS